MMRWIHRAAGLILFSGLLFSALTFLPAAFQGGEAWSTFTAGLEAKRGDAILYGMGVLVLTTLYLLTGLRSRQSTDFLAYETENGSVSISLKALQDVLVQLKNEDGHIVSLRPEVRAVHDELDVALDVRVKVGGNVPMISERLQEQCRTLIRDRIGIRDIRNVEVRIQEFIGKAQAGEEPIEVKAEPFRGGS